MKAAMVIANWDGNTKIFQFLQRKLADVYQSDDYSAKRE